jgi:nucleotide-binding universal stress UspA family protein
MMKIVIAVDRCRHARAAVQFLRQLRWPTGSAFTLLHVLRLVTISGGWQLHYHPELWKPFTAERKKLSEQAQRFLERLGTQLRPGNARLDVLVKWGLPLMGIMEVLKEQRADLVVVGSRGLSGVRRFLLGSVSEGVLNSAPCSVLISRGQGKGASRARARYLRVLLAVDESEHAVTIARWLRVLGIPATSQVTILHVVEPPDDRVSQLLNTTAPKFREAAQALIRVTKERGRQVLERARKVVTHLGLTIHPVLVEGRPAEEIIRAAERTHADLVILGSRGMARLKGAFLGSVSRRVARHAPCSVLVVRRKGE